MMQARESFWEPRWHATLRFALELAAWIAIYFAWGIFALAAAVAALTIFSVPGDKHRVIVRVPGAARVSLELMVSLAGAAAAWQVRGPVWGLVLLAGTAALVATAYRRWRWLWMR